MFGLKIVPSEAPMPQECIKLKLKFDNFNSNMCKELILAFHQNGDDKTKTIAQV